MLLGSWLFLALHTTNSVFNLIRSSGFRAHDFRNSVFVWSVNPTLKDGIHQKQSSPNVYCSSSLCSLFSSGVWSFNVVCEAASCFLLLKKTPLLLPNQWNTESSLCSGETRPQIFHFCSAHINTCLLFALRCNGSLPNGDKDRRRSRFALCRRNEANGVRPGTVHASFTSQAAKVRGT